MNLRKWLLKKLIGKDKNILTDIFIENMSFVRDIDLERFERESQDIWSTIGYSHRMIKEWIEDRKALILRQNMIEPKDNQGLRSILMEWELISTFMGSAVTMPILPSSIDNSPDLKTQEDIMREFNKRKNI